MEIKIKSRITKLTSIQDTSNVLSIPSCTSVEFLRILCCVGVENLPRMFRALNSTFFYCSSSASSCLSLPLLLLLLLCFAFPCSFFFILICNWIGALFVFVAIFHLIPFHLFLSFAPSNHLLSAELSSPLRCYGLLLAVPVSWLLLLLWFVFLFYFVLSF